MIELFTAFKIVESYTNPVIKEGMNYDFLPTNIPTSWIILALLIAFGTAYIAFACNQYETPATRAISTIIAFFFSGIYLIYYFIYHVIFDRKCSSRGINNIVRNLTKRNNAK
jgi:hypothetical protein